MNSKYRISNDRAFPLRRRAIGASSDLFSISIVRPWLSHFLPTSFHTLCVETKQVLRRLFFLIILLSFSGTLSAQTLENIYSNLDNATSISVTQNAIYVIEQGKNRLLKLDHSGKLLDTIGGRGGGDYQFSKPVDVNATNGLKIFVSDQNNRRIQVFDRRGQFLSTIAERSTFGATRRYHPDQISVSDLGEVYFWDRDSRLIRSFDMDYNFDFEFRVGSDIKSVDDMQITSTEILLLDWSTETLHRLSPNGGYSGFYPAEGIKAFFVYDRGIWKSYVDRVVFEPKNGQIQKFEFEKNIQPIDLHVQSGSIFILTSDALFKIESGKR